MRPKLSPDSCLRLARPRARWPVPGEDAPLKALRDPDAFTRVIHACPTHAHWLDGRPITGVLPMAGVLDRYRRFVVDDQPGVTGFAAVGDAWACTDPSAGLSVGLVHAQQLRHLVRSALDRPAQFAHSWDDLTQQHVMRFYHNQVAADRARVAEMYAARTGIAHPSTIHRCPS